MYTTSEVTAEERIGVWQQLSKVIVASLNAGTITKDDAVVMLNGAKENLRGMTTRAEILEYLREYVTVDSAFLPAYFWYGNLIMNSR